jgi:hypothetical protein
MSIFWNRGGPGTIVDRLEAIRYDLNEVLMRNSLELRFFDSFMI